MRFRGICDGETIGFLQLGAVVHPSIRRLERVPPAKRLCGTGSERVEDDGAAQGGVWCVCDGIFFIGASFQSDSKMIRTFFTARQSHGVALNGTIMTECRLTGCCSSIHFKKVGHFGQKWLKWRIMAEELVDLCIKNLCIIKIGHGRGRSIARRDQEAEHGGADVDATNHSSMVIETKSLVPCRFLARKLSNN